MMSLRKAHWAHTVMVPCSNTSSRNSLSGGEWGKWSSSALTSAWSVASPVSHKSTVTPEAAAVAATVKACIKTSGRSLPHVHLMTSDAMIRPREWWLA